MASFSTPVAVFSGLALAGMFAGLGLYFGLRERSVATRVSPDPGSPLRDAVESTSASARVGIASSAVAVAQPSSTSGASQAVTEARRAVDAEHAKLVHDCWEPSLSRRALPAEISLIVTLQYGPDGHLGVRSLEQDGAKARPDVTMCVDKELKLGSITAPGERLRINVPINFP